MEKLNLYLSVLTDIAFKIYVQIIISVILKDKDKN